jgi:hypothetical protein
MSRFAWGIGASIAVLLAAVGITYTNQKGTQVRSKPADFLDDKICSIQLMDDDSGRRFVTAYGFSRAKASAGLERTIFVSEDGDELLELFQHPGAKLHEYAEYKVRKIESNEETQAIPTSVKKFVSGRGIALGMQVDSVLQILGKPTDRKQNGAQVTFDYRCTDGAVCPTLKAVNMPIYQASYSFKRGHLIEMLCGFPYP